MRRVPLLFCLIVGIALVGLGCGIDQTPVSPNQDTAVGPLAKPASLGTFIAAQNRHTPALMAIPGVVGTATGLGSAGSGVILALVEKPGISGIPPVLDGIPVAVRVTGKIVSRAPPPGKGGGKDKTPADPTARFDRPVPIGVSTGHPAVTAGTIGCRVTDGQKSML